jgi:CRP-like cAMP-binding protein
MPYSNSTSELENLLLKALPESDYQRLVPHLRPVDLDLGTVLYEPGETIAKVYFPQRAVVSLVFLMEDGLTVEIGIVGREGAIGIPVFLGGNRTISQAIVQIKGSALVMDAEVLKAEFERGGTLQQLFLRYTQARLTQLGLNAVKNSRYTIDKRLADWLLSIQDRVQTDELLLTHEFMANMLGTRRPGVTEAIGVLSKAGMIRRSRGKITILNREELEAKAGECYQTVRNEFERLLDTEIG